MHAVRLLLDVGAALHAVHGESRSRGPFWACEAFCGRGKRSLPVQASTSSKCSALALTKPSASYLSRSVCPCQVSRSGGSEQPLHRVNVTAVVRRLLAEGGVGAFYKGLLPRSISMALWGTAMVSTYEFLSKQQSTTQHSTAPYRTGQHSTVGCSAVDYHTAQHRRVRLCPLRKKAPKLYC